MTSGPRFMELGGLWRQYLLRTEEWAVGQAQEGPKGGEQFSLNGRRHSALEEQVGQSFFYLHDGLLDSLTFVHLSAGVNGPQYARLTCEGSRRPPRSQITSADT